MSDRAGGPAQPGRDLATTTAIRGGTVVTARGRAPLDLLIRAGQISALLPRGGPADDVQQVQLGRLPVASQGGGELWRQMTRPRVEVRLEEHEHAPAARDCMDVGGELRGCQSDTDHGDRYVRHSHIEPDDHGGGDASQDVKGHPGWLACWRASFTA